VNNVACFITPLLVGISVYILGKRLRIYNRLRLNILVYLLIGGALVLAAEHAWHGEIVPYPPFLTAMKSAEEISIALHEISTVGSTMTFAVAMLWLGTLYISRTTVVKTSSIAKIGATSRA